MRYFISSNFKNLSMNWEIYVFYWEQWNFEPILNYAYMAERLALVKTLHKNMDYFLYYPRRQHVQSNHFEYKFTFSNGG